mmetsp:Transcript_784/g.1139  ORF Transcript_784/g.1139 Transcript_784/m.1139 type:complete len:282 (-) Transcript_784:534-1379(-)
MLAVIETVVCSMLDIMNVHITNPREDLSRCHPPSVCQHLPAHIFTNVGEHVQLHEHVGLQLCLGSGYLLFRDILAEVHQPIADLQGQLPHVLVRHHTVQPDEASVFVAGVEGGVGVAQLLVRQALQELAVPRLAHPTGAIPAAHDGLQDHEGEGPLAGPAGALEGQGDVRVLLLDPIAPGHQLVAAREHRGVVQDEQVRAGVVAVLLVRRRRQPAEEVLRHVHQLLVLQCPRPGHHHAWRGVVGLDVPQQVLPRQAPHILLGAQNSATQTCTIVGHFMQIV